MQIHLVSLNELRVECPFLVMTHLVKKMTYRGPIGQNAL